MGGAGTGLPHVGVVGGEISAAVPIGIDLLRQGQGGKQKAENYNRECSFHHEKRLPLDGLRQDAPGHRGIAKDTIPGWRASSGMKVVRPKSPCVREPFRLL